MDAVQEKGISEVDQLRGFFLSFFILFFYFFIFLSYAKLRVLWHGYVHGYVLFVSLLFKRYVGMSTFHRKPLWFKFTPETVSDCVLQCGAVKHDQL